MAIHNLNDLYRRVISSNVRLQQLKTLYAPEIVVRNEKRVLHAAVGELSDHEAIRQSIADVGADAFIRYFNYITGTEIRFPTETKVTLAEAA